ncbi:alpha-1,2-mannosyltransferase [Herbihabitans rhizosphaerae]|uniref:Alpha-1,2-mannosyltransferase n=1 Tax=Herbihabitans rhizosphaerae TaxID=1872711 RepID=A0A4Q7KG38_9PSEU|nr:glycosyltransferase 87 family protein [Herbihabitans rhizosphaerae]RZS33878.1 alpha-1,2-mannosyltransferase [Herbihabitans rhizosphaerae]
MTRLRWVAGSVAVALVVVGVIGAVTGWHLGADSAVYRAGALALLHGDPLYESMSLPASPPWQPLPFTYPPTAALLFTPLAALPVQVAWGVLAALSVLALAVVVKVCFDCLPTLSGRAWLPAGALLLAFGLEPVWWTITLGQINLILLALIVVDVLVLRGNRWSGVLIGIAAAVKLTPLIFVAHLLVTGRRADAARATGVFLGLQALIFVISPSDVARYWTVAGIDPDRIGRVYWIFNQSLNGLVRRLTFDAGYSTVVAFAIGALLAVPAVLLVRHYHRKTLALQALLVSAGFGLLVSPVSWSHHWVWAVPLLIVLVARASWVPVAIVWLVFLGATVWLTPNGADKEFHWNPLTWTLGNSYVLVPIVVGVWFGVHAWRNRASPAPRTGESRAQAPSKGGTS